MLNIFSKFEIIEKKINFKKSEVVDLDQFAMLPSFSFIIEGHSIRKSLWRYFANRFLQELQVFRVFFNVKIWS